jgi:hypothetical protein
MIFDHRRYYEGIKIKVKDITPELGSESTIEASNPWIKQIKISG